MLGGGNPLTVGVGIVIEVIRKNNSDYDPDVGTESSSVPSSRDPIYLGTLLRLFAQSVPDFMSLIMHVPVQKQRIHSTFGDKIEPLGFDRFKTCELMAELLHCSNMGLLNEVGSEELISSRDVERQRLRIEGKLTPVRGEEVPPPAEDLTMRVSHSSPQEGRRLEVTNVSEDDGFEEVEHSGDMNEDTSHEFVNAEEEIAAITAVPASSFLDKDDDDFVDEPLTSPQPNIHDEKAIEQQFEEPDLVVAPLSPTKVKAASNEEPEKAEDSTAEPEVEPSPPKVEDLSLDEKPDAESTPVSDDKDSRKGEESDSSVVYTPSVSEPDHQPVHQPEHKSDDKPESLEPKTVESETEKPSGGLSPHPEDTPAPLFSKSTTQPSALPESELKTDMKPATEASAAETAGTEQEAGIESIIVAPPPAEAADREAESMNPVVGDFLKMQFVEYRVVPTILVSAQGYDHLRHRFV
jgi:SIT4-associating protein SAP185/190